MYLEKFNIIEEAVYFTEILTVFAPPPLIFAWLIIDEVVGSTREIPRYFNWGNFKQRVAACHGSTPSGTPEARKSNTNPHTSLPTNRVAVTAMSTPTSAGKWLSKKKERQPLRQLHLAPFNFVSKPCFVWPRFVPRPKCNSQTLILACRIAIRGSHSC